MNLTILSNPKPVLDPLASTAWLWYFHNQFARHSHASWTHHYYVTLHIPFGDLWPALVMGITGSILGDAIPGIYLCCRYKLHPQVDCIRDHDSPAVISQCPCNSSWLEFEELELGA